MDAFLSPGPLEQPSPTDQPSPVDQLSPVEQPSPAEQPPPANKPSPGIGSTPSPAQAPSPELAAALAAARQELEQSLGQLAELEQLIVELPGIFERKFAQRLQPLLERQRLLSEDNHALREHLQLGLPPAREGQARLGQLPKAPAAPAGSPQAPASPSPAQGPPAWRQRLYQATRRLLRRGP